MSVSGILDAMRSDRPLSQRLVWQCLENHSNGHRFWSISITDLAAELHLRRGTVIDAIKALERDLIIRARRVYKQATTYFMLRTYGEQADPEPEPSPPDPGLETAPQIEPMPENVPTMQSGIRPSVQSEIRPVVSPPRKNPPIKEETSLRSVRAREQPPTEPDLFEQPQPPPSSAGTRLPPDWRPTPNDFAFAGSEGFSTAETERIADQFRDFWHAKAGKDGRKASWPATWRNWVREDRRRSAPRRPPAKQPNKLDYLRRYLAGEQAEGITP